MDRQKTRLTVKVSLVFTIYMETNTSETFYSSTSDKNCPADFITRKIETLGSIFSHETEGLLASHTTILESLYETYTESSIKNPNFLKALSISSKSCFVSASTK